jgi:hypothetical protein
MGTISYERVQTNHPYRNSETMTVRKLPRRRASARRCANDCHCGDSLRIVIHECSLLG